MQKRDLYYERIPTKLLREDVRYLGNILGKVIKEQEGQNFFNLVEKVRKLSKVSNKSLNVKNTNKKVIETIKNLNPKNTFKLTRAFTHFMNFINLAELIDASRSLNEYENDKKKISDNNLFIEEIFENLFNNDKISDNKMTSFVTFAVTLGFPSLSPPIQEPNSIGLKFFGKPLPIF